MMSNHHQATTRWKTPHQALTCVLVLLLSCMTSVVSASSNFLYRDDNNANAILEYDININEFEKSTKPKVVEFYNPFCGHCIGFKPKYIKIATETQQKYPQVEFYAVSCRAHSSMCDKYNAHSMPTIILFKDGQPVNENNSIHPEGGAYGVLSVSSLSQMLDLDKPQLSTTDHYSTQARGLEEAEFFAEEEFRGDEEEVLDEDQEEDENFDADIDADAEMDEGEQENDVDPRYAANGGEEQQNPFAAGMNEDEMQLIEDAEEAEQADEDEEEALGFREESKTKSEDQEDYDEEQEQLQREEDEEFGMGANPEFNRFRPPPQADRLNRFPDPRNRPEDRMPRPNFADPQFRKNRAGARKAKEMKELKAKNLDKYKQYLAERKKKYDKKQKWKKLNPFKKKKLVNFVDMRDMKEGETKLMKAHRKGTTEFTDRQKKIQAKVDKKKKKEKTLARRAAKWLGGKKYKTDEDRYNRIAEKKKQYLKKKFEKRRKKGGLQPEDVFTKEELEMMTSGANVEPKNVPFKKQLKKPHFIQKTVEKIPIVKSIYKMTEEEELILDASLSFVASLKYGVFTNKDILTLKQKRALKSWLELMSVSLPPEWGLHELIDDLLNNINIIAKSEKKLQFILDNHELPRSTWSRSCTKGVHKKPTKGGMVGFACGFWKLMHLSSVGVAEHRGGINLIESGINNEDTRTFSPMEAANTIRDFIENFYSCNVCREKFITIYDECDNNRRCDRLNDSNEDIQVEDWQEMAKWMWELHNDFNVKILHDKNKNSLSSGRRGRKKQQPGDEDEIQVLWPSIEECVSCFNEDGSWNDDAVFLFLEKTYWMGSELDKNADRLLQFEEDVEETGDIILMWLFCFIILGIIYFATKNSSVVAMRKAAVVAGRNKKRWDD